MHAALLRIVTSIDVIIQFDRNETSNIWLHKGWCKIGEIEKVEKEGAITKIWYRLEDK